YFGANLEIPGDSLTQTVHAEQSALANAYMWGERQIVCIAVTAVPCGHCRQFLHEFSIGHDVRVLVPGNPAKELSELLPLAFDLGAAPRTIWRLTINDEDELALGALEAAATSYAPHSKSPSGVAIRSKGGAIFCGSYIENAAFNPSLAPFQAALA